MLHGKYYDNNIIFQQLNSKLKLPLRVTKVHFGGLEPAHTSAYDPETNVLTTPNHYATAALMLPGKYYDNNIIFQQLNSPIEL